MKHIYWVYENEVAGRPGPGIEPWDFGELKNGGFNTILSAASDLFSHHEIIGTGIERTCIPLPDLIPPDQNTIEICSTAIPLAYEFIKKNVENNRKVLIHCAGGNDRTGIVLAYYISRRENISAEEAVEILRNIRPSILWAEGWEKMALELINT